jgi:hypothetical protein
MYLEYITLVCFTVARAILSPDVQEWHLVRCLKSVSHRYFSTGQTLVMSLHEDTAHVPGRRHGNLTNFGGGSIDVSRYISEEMHKTKSRSVVITNTFVDYGIVDWNSNLSSTVMCCLLQPVLVRRLTLCRVWNLN